MLTLETPRLLIRNFRSNDGPALYHVTQQYAASPLGKYDHEWPKTQAEIQGVVDWFATGDQFLAVCLKDSGQFIGFISLSKSDNTATVEYNLGYIFDFDYHGRGYATEGCQALVNHTFTVWQANCITSGTAAANEPSCRLLAHLGFKITSAGTGHFQTAPDGTPYEFRGYNFELTRDNWAKAQEAEQ